MYCIVLIHNTGGVGGVLSYPAPTHPSPTLPNHAMQFQHFHTEKLKPNVIFIEISMKFHIFTKQKTNVIFKINFMKSLAGASLVVPKHLLSPDLGYYLSLRS